MMDYYVYEVHYCGILAYIGQGKGDRIDHVCSGASHNKFLNEVYFRNKILGEPPAAVGVKKWYKTNKEAVTAEKYLIGRLNPLFNITHCKNKSAKLFSASEREALRDFDSDFWVAVGVFEKMCLEFGINPRFALTPIGATLSGNLRFDTDASFDLAGLSILGCCEPLDNYFDWVAIGKGVFKVWVDPAIVKILQDCLGGDYFVFDRPSKTNGGCLYDYDEYDPNEHGRTVPDGYWNFAKDGMILCRTIGERRATPIVLALYAVNSQYEIRCENSGQVVHTSREFGSSLRVYRMSELRGDCFVVWVNGRQEPLCPIDLTNVMDFNNPIPLQIP